MRLVLALAVLLAGSASAQPAVPDTIDVRVATWTSLSSLSDIVDAAAEAEVLFLGEYHDDSLAHVAQLHLLRALAEADRPVVLALEMFETDVQPVLDEYLAGLIRERDWLAAGRPWSNYETDYRPLVELARETGMPVVATNAPGRYVSLVSRRGVDVLDSLGATARAWMPPEIGPPSDTLSEKFFDLMGGMSHGDSPSVDRMLAAQNLRDATMAWRIADALAAHPGALVVHVNGSFHSEGGLGIPEHLPRWAPSARTVIVTMAPDSVPTPGDDFSVRTER